MTFYLYFYFKCKLVYVNTLISTYRIASHRYCITPLPPYHSFHPFIYSSFVVYLIEITDVIAHRNSMFSLLHSINGIEKKRKFVHPFFIRFIFFLFSSKLHLHIHSATSIESRCIQKSSNASLLHMVSWQAVRGKIHGSKIWVFVGKANLHSENFPSNYNY